MRYRNARPTLPGPAPQAARIRPAHRGDLIALDALVRQSLDLEAARVYSARQRAALADGPLRVDLRLVDDGTLWVAEAGGRIVASAGWTMRADDSAHQRLATHARARHPAFIRGVMVHPLHAGQGWARRMVGLVEGEAIRLGDACSALLVSTINAAPFYAHLGYRLLYVFEDDRAGSDLHAFAMGRPLGQSTAPRAAA